VTNRLKLGLVLGLLVPILAIGTAAALDTPGTTTNQQPPKTTDQTSTSTTEPSNGTTANNVSPTVTDTLASRLELRKNDLKISLSTIQKEHLLTRCKPAQSNLKPLGTRLNDVGINRNKTYDAIYQKLTDFETQLKGSTVDTTQLMTELAVLQTEIAGFKTDMLAYKTAVNDLQTMDCASDPTAFQASLQTARTLHDKLKQDSATIMKEINDTIKPTLLQIRSKLPASSTTQGGN